MTDTGEGLADYAMFASEWLIYETHWHTGKFIRGLLEAGKVLDRPDLIGKAELGGQWWVSTEYPEGHPFAGLISPAHGGAANDGEPDTEAIQEAIGVFAGTGGRVSRAAGTWDTGLILLR